MPVTACPHPEHHGGTGRAGRGHSTRGQCLQGRIPWLCGHKLQTQRCFCARISWHCAAALEKVFHVQRWHWKAGFSPGTAVLLLGVYFWCLPRGCLLPALALLECRDQSGCVSFLCVIWIKTSAERTETTARGSECFTMSTSSESGFSEVHS